MASASAGPAALAFLISLTAAPLLAETAPTFGPLTVNGPAPVRFPVPFNENEELTLDSHRTPRRTVMKKAIPLFTAFTVLFLGTVLLALSAPQQGGAMDNAQAQAAAKKKKQDRWEGVITRSDKTKKTLTVRQRSSGLERFVIYDEGTQWTSQFHNTKKVNIIDADQVKDNDRVICLGTFDKSGVLHATLISKRLPE